MNESSSVMKDFVSKAAAVSGKFNDRTLNQIHFFNNPGGTLKLSVKSGDLGATLASLGIIGHQTGNWE
jgi:hypothetical protein